jgi:hypothetical protein
MRAAAYVRLSKEDREGARSGIESCLVQQSNAKRAIDTQGWRLVDNGVFVDDDVSGAEILRRPKLQAILAAVERNAFDVLVLRDLDRLAHPELRIWPSKLLGQIDALLARPRRTSWGAATPRHLASSFVRCGVCGASLVVAAPRSATTSRTSATATGCRAAPPVRGSDTKRARGRCGIASIHRPLDGWRGRVARSRDAALPDCESRELTESTSGRVVSANAETPPW